MICAPAAAAPVLVAALAASSLSGEALPGAFTELLESRRSVRLYSDSALALSEVRALLWAGCGDLADGRMTVPSAGALYPLRLLLAAGDVEGLEPGVYLHDPSGGPPEPLAAGDPRPALADACLGQPWVASAPASIVICAVPSITSERYGLRGGRYVLMEAGCSCQNIYLACASMGLGTVAVGAFDDDGVSEALDLEDGLVPVCVMPVGRPAGVTAQ